MMAKFKIRQEDGTIKRMTVSEYLAIARTVRGMADRFREFAHFGKKVTTR